MRICRMFHVNHTSLVDAFDRAEIEKHPLDILLYAAKHIHYDLLDKAAEMVIGQPLDAAVDRMPPTIALAWVRKFALLAV
jgi:hypothetical protein